MKNNEKEIKITKAKGRPLLHWIGKRPLDRVASFPAQLVENFDVNGNSTAMHSPSYDALQDNWQNLLFHGDNKDVLGFLLANGFRNKIDLIYIDPPFMSGSDYLRRVQLRGQSDVKTDVDDADLLQQTMYYDIWNNDNYLQFIYERLTLLKELLSEKGSIYVHLDWHIGHYVKVMMDEIFGKENFQNEVVWCYKTREF